MDPKLDVNNFLQRTLVLLLWVMSCLFTSFYSSKSPCEELWNNPNISGSQECVWVTPKKKQNNFSLDFLVQNLRHTKERTFRFCWVYIIRILYYRIVSSTSGHRFTGVFTASRTTFRQKKPENRGCFPVLFSGAGVQWFLDSCCKCVRRCPLKQSQIVIGFRRRDRWTYQFFW